MVTFYLRRQGLKTIKDFLGSLDTNSFDMQYVLPCYILCISLLVKYTFFTLFLNTFTLCCTINRIGWYRPRHSHVKMIAFSYDKIYSSLFCSFYGIRLDKAQYTSAIFIKRLMCYTFCNEVYVYTRILAKYSWNSRRWAK